MNLNSIEDLIETSVDLNNRSIVFLNTLASIVAQQNPRPEPFTSDLAKYMRELIEFMTEIELSASEEGEIDTNEYPDRKIH